MDKLVFWIYTSWRELSWHLSWQMPPPSVCRQIWFSSLQGRTRPQTERIHLKCHPEGTCFSSPIPVSDAMNCWWPANQKLKRELWSIPDFSWHEGENQWPSLRTTLLQCMRRSSPPPWVPFKKKASTLHEKLASWRAWTSLSPHLQAGQVDLPLFLTIRRPSPALAGFVRPVSNLHAAGRVYVQLTPEQCGDEGRQPLCHQKSISNFWLPKNVTTVIRQYRQGIGSRTSQRSPTAHA